jgi:hypothetical protein
MCVGFISGLTNQKIAIKSQSQHTYVWQKMGVGFDFRADRSGFFNASQMRMRRQAGLCRQAIKLSPLCPHESNPFIKQVVSEVTIVARCAIQQFAR